ncbi:MAG TPA: ATP-binding protein [Kofleriaceae bacterium]|nr:ATP-binding protein [Kofleriaceae bacterium]
MKRAWPVALDDPDPDVCQRRTVVALETVVGRIRVASFFYPVLFAAYLLLVLDAPAGDVGATVAALGIQLGLAVARAVAYHRSTHARQLEPDVWRRVVAIAAASVMFVWDAYLMLEVALRGFDSSTMLLLAASLVFRASGTYGAAPDLYIHGVWSRWSRLPLLAAPFMLPMRDGAVLAFALLSQFVYGEVQAKQLNAEFWRRIVATDSLAAAHAELRREVAMRERAEVELRLAQKLESVGRLAAGIAHEINTPLQAIVGSIAFVDDNASELVAIARAYRDGTATPEQADELEFLATNLPESLLLANECLERTATIVRSVKSFARSSSDAKRRLDVNEAIETTLAITRHECAKVADVVTELGELPIALGYAGELNQALLNIIVNAVHAMADVPARGTLRIATRFDAGTRAIVIAIADTGVGIPDAIKDRVFDPFFTTKDVGKGSGQGLAIARTVIAQRHGGDIAFESKPGRGTTFTLRLPVDAADPDRAAA